MKSSHAGTYDHRWNRPVHHEFILYFLIRIQIERKIYVLWLCASIANIPFKSSAFQSSIPVNYQKHHSLISFIYSIDRSIDLRPISRDNTNDPSKLTINCNVAKMSHTNKSLNVQLLWNCYNQRCFLYL